MLDYKKNFSNVGFKIRKLIALEQYDLHQPKKYQIEEITLFLLPNLEQGRTEEEMKERSLKYFRQLQN